MRKTTYVNSGFIVFLVLSLLFSTNVFAQLPVPFSPRLPGGSIKVKGDVVLIGNGIVTAKDLPLPYNGTDINNNNDGVYVNVASGGDPSIFSSSSADLFINNSCKRILYAGLYWASVYPLEVANNRAVQFEGTPRLEDWNQIKFKLPTGGFIDLVADNNADPVGEEDDIIFDGYEYYGPGVENSFKDSPIICYKNVTSLLQGLPDADGEYTVANLRATRGIRRGGCSAGWTLVVVYESPILPSKFISTFDGYAGVQNTTELDIPVSGFQTLPSPLPVNSNIGVSALEGDIGITGDSFQFKASTSGSYTVLSDALNGANNFFNSTITKDGVHVLNRNPASLNTLGLDINNFNLPNPLNSVLPNDATAGDLKLTTNGDGYGVFLTSFAVEIIEPNIVLTKIVEDATGTDISNQLVDLGDELNYVIGFQNTGNDDATNLIIRDVLPINVTFNYPADISLLPPGVTVQSYNPATRELIFSVDNSLVEENDPVQEIRFKVTVVTSCSLLTDACSNIISNQAYVTYNGTTDPTFFISDDPSFSSNTGCLITPAATNFLADLNCVFEEEVVLCGATATLTAGDGYDSYSWSTSPSGTPVIGSSQSITVSSTGTYYVRNTAIAPCQSIDQVFEVITFGAGVTNPVIPFADEVVICPNDGKELPNIYLCGANDSVFIQTGITDTTSIIWEVLDETSCSAVTNIDCANEDPACNWNQVQTGPDFTANTAGQYRLTLNYEGGCFNQFYFNVYTNLLEPTVTSRDIICSTPGEIIVGNVPTGYEYSIDGVNYQPSNVFSIITPNIYNVYVRQIGVTPNPCVFSVPDVQIRERDFNVSTIITQPFCNGGQGSVIIAANDARPQYFYSIFDGATLVNSVGPITNSDYTFNNLNPGIYTINVSTEDGCVFAGDIEIINPPLLEATSALTSPLTCTDGEITVYPVGGTPPYYYFVNSTTVFQSTPIINVPTAGVYDILVVDSNNCSANTSITVNAIPEPDFTISKTDILCADAVNSGSINFNVTNANGSTLAYSIDNGVTFSNSPVFNGLSAGNYETIVRYTIGTDVCTSAPQTITINIADAITGIATLTTPYTCITNGAITVSGVTGGTAPYSYSIDGVNFQPGLTFSGLADGTYTITIRDANNCTFITAPVTIDPLNPPTDLAFTSTPLTCPAITSDVTLTATGGLSPLEYQIIAPAFASTGYQTSNIFSGLSPDTYTFQVRDANDCIYTESFTIAPLPPLTLNTVISKDIDCTVSPDGIVTGNITGGTAPFTYQASFNGGTYGASTSVTGTIFTHAAPTDGTYQFLITDASGCTVESGVQTLNPPVAVTASDSAVDPTCEGYNDGSIRLTGLTGQAPFTYSIDGGVSFVSSNVFGGLVAGTYNYVVRDSKSCDVSGTVNLTNPLPISVTINRNPVQCITNTNVPGSLNVTIDSGGVAPFVYTLYDNTFTQIGASVTTALTTNTFSGLSFGDYYVTIVDSNGCEYGSTAQRIETPPSINLVGNATTGSCVTGATVDISVVSGAGPFTYSIFGQPATSFGPTASTTHTFSGLNHGVTYQFQVIDSGGCFSTIEVTTPILSAIDINSITTTDVSCNGDNSGVVNFTVSSYDASVTSLYYEVQDELTNLPIIPAQNGTFTGLTGASVSGSITGLPAGNYTLFVREADGTLCTASETFRITQPIQPLLAAISSEINANCNVGAQVTITTSGGTGPYQYAAGALGFVPTLADFGSSNVLNLDYTIRTNWDIVVRDANGCEVRINEDIDIDPEPVIAASLNNQCTVTEGNFAIDVTLTSPGIAPYTYSVDGGVFQAFTAPFTVSNLSSGTHTIEVQDANGCGNLVSVDIEAPIDLIPNVSALPTCNDDDGEITITGSGGSGTYTYSILPNPTSISLSGNIFSGVPSGTYTVTITDAITSCSTNVSIFVPAAIPVTFTTTSTPVTCFGDNDGTIGINITGTYTGPYNYEIFDSTSTSVFGVISANTSINPEIVSGLQGGNYTVVVTETGSPFCSTTSGTVTVGSPLAPLTIVATETSNVTCDNNSGTITAVASDGWGAFEYELTGAATVAYSPNGTFTNLSAGTYTVNVRDAGGCIASDSTTLVIPPSINATVTASTSTLSCFGDTNASITVTTVSGGQGSNYSYTLNMLAPTVTSSGPQTTPVFNNLGAGIYNVVVTDGYNCSFNSPNIVITEPTQIQTSLVKETSQTCTTSSTLTLSATGGNGPYTYSNSPTFTSVLGTFTTDVTFPVSSGTYMYYVRDANGCDTNASNEITIDLLPVLTVSLDATNANINCAGDNSGVIVADAQGGLGSYTYTLQDTAGNDITPVTQNSPGVFTNLTPGNYQVRVESGDCLTISAQIPVTEPSAPVTATFVATDVTCPGSNNGRLEITASGGTGIIKYAISPRLDQFFESPIFDNLPPGNYQAIAQDELGCFVTDTFTINDPVPVALTIVANSIIPEACEGDLDGEFSIDISGGEMPYSVSLDDINGPYTAGTLTQTQFDFTGLAGGD
ncbi:beta strand repeat-containing protein, partial [Psychroserpens sp.]|uniref:beta strand repeat-containing protein n=1 Tax=Psychroserpens sp. TaxID=2020870 RepID=UPI00385E457D